MKHTKGFTLIELMVVVAIMGILASLALPSFSDRIIREKVNEAFAVSEFVLEGIEDYYMEKQAFPSDNKAAGLPVPEKIIGNYVTRIDVVNGSVNITLGNRINAYVAGGVVSIRPAVVKDEPAVPIAWIYGYASVPEGMTVASDNMTTVDPRYLPVNCRY